MRRRSLVALLSTGIMAAAALSSGACEDDPVAHPCTNIPPGGCPLSDGVACEDPTCLAVYLCRSNNVWELSQMCPAHEGGIADAAGGVLDGGDAEAGDAAAGTPTAEFDASLDAPPGANGGPGCEDLQVPDCSLGLALACGPGCCGCGDLFVCNQGGWDVWGECTDGGIVQGR
jgi:hypothetical protein